MAQRIFGKSSSKSEVGQFKKYSIVSVQSGVESAREVAVNGEHGWEESALRVQFYVPGGMSVYETFPWETAVCVVKDDLYGKAQQSSDSAGITLAPKHKYLLKVSSRLPGFDGSRLITDEDGPISGVECIQFCQENRIVPKIALVKHEAKPRPTDQQEILDQVAALVGVDFSGIVDEEIHRFRESMQLFRRKEEARRQRVPDDPRDWLIHRIPISLCSPVPPTMPDFFVVSVRIPKSNEIQSQKVRVNTKSDSVDDTIAEAFRKFHVKRMIADGKTAADFIFKITGYEEYLFGPELTVAYDSIRSRLKKDHQIDLSLVDISQYKLPKKGEPMVEPKVQVDKVEEGGAAAHNRLGVNRSSMVSAGSFVVREEIDDLFDLEEVADLSLSQLNRHFRIRCVGCDGLYEPSALGVASVLSLFRDNNLRVVTYLEVSLCFGGEPLCATRFTVGRQGLCTSPRWNEWLRFDMLMNNLPVGCRLCVTLWGEGRGKADVTRVPLAWVNVPLIDRQHHFRQGLISLRMFRDDAANPLGTCSENYTDLNAPLLFLEFEMYSQPLRFPSKAEQMELGKEIAKRRRQGDIPLTDSDRERLAVILSKHPLSPLSPEDKVLLWRARLELIVDHRALPKFLRSVNWADRDSVAESYVLLELWLKPPPLDALELLSSKFADPEVRRVAIACLDALADSEVIDLLPQLVQTLKSELHLDSELARFLLSRGLRNPFKVGHNLFWLFKAEMHVPETSQRFGLLLEEFVKGCNAEYRKWLVTECDVFERLLQVAEHVTHVEKEKRNEAVRAELKQLELPNHFLLPLDSKWAASGVVVEKCRAMDSKKVPLWLTLKNADEEGDNLVTMLKCGDDLRQDIVTLQLIRIMDKLWEREGLELRMNTYDVTATGDNTGMLEIVLNSVTYASITEAAGGATKVLDKARVSKWLRENNPTQQSFDEAVENFTYSAAGYCVATYVLGIGDRHDDNIMLTRKGHLLHIDFGHFLGHFKDFKKIPGVKIRRERTPFVFTPDWAHVMGGLKSDQFKKFEDLCCRAFQILRRNAALFINMFAMMLSTGIPELQDEDDIQYMIDVLKLDLSEDDANNHFKKLIIDSHNNLMKLVDGFAHIVAHK